MVQDKRLLSPGTSKIRLYKAMKDTLRQWIFVAKESFLAH